MVIFNSYVGLPEGIFTIVPVTFLGAVTLIHPDIKHGAYIIIPDFPQYDVSYGAVIVCIYIDKMLFQYMLIGSYRGYTTWFFDVYGELL